jgi:hypothetical protein
MEVPGTVGSDGQEGWPSTIAGVEAAAGRPPSGGRAPGWEAGLVAARRIGSPFPAEAAA